MTPSPIADAEPVILHPAEPHPRPGLTGRSRRRLAAGLIAVLAVAGGAVGVGKLTGHLPGSVVAGDPAASGRIDPPPTPPRTVKVVRPKHDPSVAVTVDQLATVEPFYRADLRARASGLVRTVYKEIGDRVHRGDLLIEIDVPEAAQEVAQKEAVVAQRLQEVRLSKALRKDAEADKAVALAAVKEKDALVASAEATRDYKLMLFTRLRQLGASDSVTRGAIAEQERDYKASEAAVAAARAAVERARADVTQAESKIEAAAADIDLKFALVEVARRDLGRAQAAADYARVVAPFDGVVVRRSVNPGSFVQNATTGQSEALISVSRTDVVTVVARFPDTAAPFITPGTEAEVTVDSLPGLTITGRVTRFAPSISAADKKIQVEVDLFNGDEVDFRRIVGRVIGAKLAPLADPNPFAQAAAGLAETTFLAGLHKGDGDFLPAGALPHSQGDRPPRLVPGMTGNVKLLLNDFHDGYALPSTAVYYRTGKPYILVVENGVTREFPVQVQVNDGRVAKIAYVDHRKDPATGAVHDVLTELTGREQVVSTRQLEVGEGAAVQAAVSKW